MPSLIDAVQSGDVTQVKDYTDLHKELHSFSKDGEAPIHIAVKLRNVSILEHLLKAGANVNQASEESGNTKGYTAAHYAARQGDLDSLAALIKHKADLNRGSSDGWTPLHCAVFSNHQQFARKLVDAGADVNAKNEHGVTPVIYAASKSLNQLLRLFLEKGADLTPVDVHGDSILHHVFHYQMQKLFEGEYELPEAQYDVGVTLAVAGAEVDALNNDGKTAFEYLDDEMPAYHDVLRILSHNQKAFNASKTQWNYMTLVSCTVEVYMGMGLDIKHAVDLTEKANKMEKERLAEKKRKEEERPAGGCPIMKSGGRRKKKGAAATAPEIPADGSDPSGGQCPFFQKKDGEGAATASEGTSGAGATKTVDTPHGKMDVPADGSDPSKGQCPFFKSKSGATPAATPSPAAEAAKEKKIVDALVKPHQASPSAAVTSHKAPASLWEAVYENRTTLLLLVIAFFCGIWFEQMMAPLRGVASRQ